MIKEYKLDFIKSFSLLSGFLLFFGILYTALFAYLPSGTIKLFPNITMDGINLYLVGTYIFLSFVLSSIFFVIFFSKNNIDLFKLSFLNIILNLSAFIGTYYIAKHFFEANLFEKLINNPDIFNPQIEKSISMDHAKIIISTLTSVILIGGVTVFFISALLYFSIFVKKPFLTNHKLIELKVPPYLVWYFILSWAWALYAFTNDIFNPLIYVAVNSIIILSFIYSAQGMGIVLFITNKFKISRRSKLIIGIASLGLILFRPESFLLTFFAISFGLGLFDQWFNYRKFNTSG